MLRKVFRTALKEHNHRRKVIALLRLLTLVGVLWVLAFPYMAQTSFTSENALEGSFMSSNFRSNKLLKPAYTKFKEDLDALNSEKDIHTYVRDVFKNRAEVYN